MILDDFLIALGVKADTRALADVERGLENVEQQVENTDKSLSKFSGKVGTAIKSFAGFAVAAAGAIKGVMVGAWAYLDSTIDRVEELQNSEDESIRTTKEQVEMAKKYRENMEKMGNTIENVKTKVALAFLPAMLELSNQYATLIEKNKDLITNGINKFLAAVTKAAQVVTNFVRFIRLAVESTIGWRGALMAIVAALVILRRGMILAFIANPITWVMAALAGLILLIDDFMTFLDGGESEFAQYWSKLISWIVSAKMTWNNFSEEAKSAIKALIVALGILASSTLIIGAASKVFAVLGAAVRIVLSPVKLLFTALVMLGKGVMLAGRAFLVAGRMMLANPMVLVAVAVGVVIYALIDLIKWIRTGESQFGSFWQVCADVWASVVAVVSSAIESVVNYVSKMFDSIVATVSSIIEAFANAWNTVVSTTKSIFNSITSFFVSLFNGWVSLVSATVSGIGSAFSAVFDMITSPFKKAFDWVADKWGDFKGIFSGGVAINTNVNGNIAAAATSSGNKTINNVSTTNASINVSGAGNPQAVANNVQKNLNNTAKKNQSGKAKA